MALRFRKNIKLLPGVKLNFGKSGVSTSLGIDGATVNIKKGRAIKTTLGIPGSGLSYTSHSATPKPNAADSSHSSYGEISTNEHENAKQRIAAIMQERPSAHERWAVIKSFFVGLLGR
jgi:hypothetical protein